MNVRTLLTLILAIFFLAAASRGVAQDPSAQDPSAQDPSAQGPSAQDRSERVPSPEDPSAEGTQQASAGDEESGYVPLTALDPRISREELLLMVRPLTKSELEVEAESWYRLLRSKARQIAAVRLGVRRTGEFVGAEDPQAAEEAIQEIEAVKQYVDDVAEKTEEEISQAARESLGMEPGLAGNAASDESASEEASSEDDGSDAENDQTNQAEPTDGEPGEADEGSEDDAATDARTDAAPAAIAADRRQELLSDIPTLQDERKALSDRLEIVLYSLEQKGGDVTEYRQYAAAVSGLEVDTSDLGATWTALVGWLQSREGGQRWLWNVAKFVFILLLTYFVAKIVAGLVNWLQGRRLRLTELAKRLISGTIKNVVFLIGFAIALTALEVDITPVLAAIGATGLVVGLALQGTLSNFASGLMILINRPFDVGNVVTAAGVTGTIHRMNLVSTTFRTFDNQTIHVPNNEIWNGVITNITANKTRRVDLEFGIGYDDDFEQAERIIREVAESHPLVLADPAAVIVTHELADSSVNIVCRPWANTTDWWQVRTEITREVKRRFDREGISIPYPQRDVHVHQIDGLRPADETESSGTV